uniref:Transmembrane protein 53 n=1 Tax=Clastoptera arizonana TaxID=38151 RepID=A0A1B6EEE2_9HEMI
MVFSRRLLTTFLKTNQQLNGWSLVTRHGYTRYTLSKNLDLLSSDDIKITNQSANKNLIIREKSRPLVIILAWLLAEKKHLSKYAEVYLNRGIDVLTVKVTPTQLVWPISGSQVVAAELLQFLHQNSICQPLYLHGFSVGAYLWSEVMVKMNRDFENYQPIINRIIGQVWDSAADVSEMEIGLPLAVFPHNKFCKAVLRKYITFHLKTFHNAATCHYLAASELFHNNLIKCPALLLVSKSDPIGSIISNEAIRKKWTNNNIKVHWKCWEDSKHVSHFLKYKSDYINTLENFLDSLILQENKDEILPQKQKVHANL